MKRVTKNGIAGVVVFLLSILLCEQIAAQIVINEVVTDPQQDWSDSEGGNGVPFDGTPGAGTITPTDEWIELFNAGSGAIDLTEGNGWSLELFDTTPDTLLFADPSSTVEFVFSNGGALANFQPGEYLVIGNAPGAMNNDIYLKLMNSSDAVIDDVEIGDDLEGDGPGDGAPDGGPGGGNATGIADEAIARVPNGNDTDNDVADFFQQMATIGFANETATCLNDGDVNGDSVLTLDDALCTFRIFLNEGNLTDECDVEGFDCELVAADANCDATITPGDALVILERFLGGLAPVPCFVPSSLGRFRSPPQLNFAQRLVTQSNQDFIKVTLVLNNPQNFAAFGLTLSYPDDQLEFKGIERTTLTEKWKQLDGAVNDAGMITIGGFNDEPLTASSPSEIFHVLFTPKKQLTNVYRFNLTDLVDDFSTAVITSVDSDPQNLTSIPKAFKLYQSYPNPLHSNAAGKGALIRFDLPGAEEVKVELAIYNITGQMVRRLISETRSPGAYEITWDGRDEQRRQVPAGIYLYRIKAGDWVDSKRVVVFR